MKNKELRIKNENYAPMSKLKSIPPSSVPFGLTKALLQPRSLQFR